MFILLKNIYTMYRTCRYFRGVEIFVDFVVCSFPTKINPLQVSIPGKFVLATESPSFLGAFEILYNAPISDHHDHVTISVMTLHMLTTDSNLFVSIYRKSVPGSQGEVMHADVPLWLHGWS